MGTISDQLWHLMRQVRESCVAIAAQIDRIDAKGLRGDPLELNVMLARIRDQIRTGEERITALEGGLNERIGDQT
jgi:hypothetical protein